MTQKALHPPHTLNRFWQEIRGYLEALFVAFIIVTFGFNTVGVVGSSMQPSLDGGPDTDRLAQSLLLGDRVFIPKYETWLRRAGLMGSYARGDVVVVREPANSPSAIGEHYRSFFIKRVIGLPSDRIRIEAGQVYVNGHALDQSFISGTGEVIIEKQNFPVIKQQNGEATELSINFLEYRNIAVPALPVESIPAASIPLNDKDVQFYYGALLEHFVIPEDAPENEPFLAEFSVPENHYFLMGDNRSEGGSEDSRYFGPIPLMAIAGKASAVIWPPRREGVWNWRQLTPPEAFREILNSQ
ncbi:MAG: signal peptidase I [Trueperaceae bacterium]